MTEQITPTFSRRERQREETRRDLPTAQDRVQPSEWAAKLRTLVAKEPDLRGEYLKAFAATEQALARAIAVRTGTGDDELWPKVLAAMVVSAERAAIRHWIQLDDPNLSFDATVRAALEQALAGVQR